MRSLILLFILAGSMSVTHANELNDFSSDGCSKSPDGIPVYSPDVFLSCCIKHDISYWQGGTEEDRLLADEDLRSCIEAKGHPDIARAYYYAVRVGGSPKFNSSYRWGYGWKEDRGYSPLSYVDKIQVVQKLLKLQSEGISIH
ncbi:helicase [Bdellovibrio sp. HCB209]|uniref:helicase n=1 Tax=Bdellovibrio sp. HCB209 TaxID=3394354 RepID=UPI0039B57D66